MPSRASTETHCNGNASATSFFPGDVDGRAIEGRRKAAARSGESATNGNPPVRERSRFMSVSVVCCAGETSAEWETSPISSIIIARWFLLKVSSTSRIFAIAAKYIRNCTRAHGDKGPYRAGADRGAFSLSEDAFGKTSPLLEV
jgi:hypothetical protein